MVVKVITMTEELVETEQFDEMVDLPTIPQVVKENPRKKTILLGVSLLAFSFVLTIIFAFVFNSLYVKNETGNGGAISWFPGNFVIEMLVFWVFPVLFLLVSILFVRFLSVFYIYLHKGAKLARYNYSLVSMDDSLLKIPEALGRAIIPFLLSFSIGYWFSGWFFGNSIDSTVSVLLIFLYAMLFSPITVIVITPLWVLDDAGIISMRKRKEGERKLPDIEGPSTYFVNLLTGSAYSLALVTLVTFIIEITQHAGEIALLGALAYIIVMFYVEWLALIYFFEIFIRKLKYKLLEKLPAKVVDTTPKIITDEKSVAVLKSIGEIVKED